jgi:4,5:9,10-diseco-3-hydroxy-5,9,17-trioxoandrosta-1(10),2-diene-4-oate hydrolase
MEYDYDFFADFTHGFLAAMGIGRAVLVGHSLGANISLYFAARHPEMVEKLILVGPGYGRRLNAFFHLASLPWVGEYLLKPPPSTRTVQDAIRLVTYRPVDYGPEIIDSYFEFQHSPGYSRALLNFLRGAMRPVGFTPKGEGYFRYLDNRIPELAQPVLVVWGKQDRVVPFSNAAHLKGLLANGEFWDLDECGHCPNYEYPDEFNRRVVSFLERAS